MTSDPARRAERLLSAAELAFELGRRDLVAHLIRDAEPLLPLARDPLSEARVTLVRGWGDTRIPQFDRVQAIAGIAQRARRAGDDDVAWNLLWRLAQRCFWADPGPEARQVVVSAVEQAGSVAGDPRAVAVLAYASPLDRANVVIDSLARWSGTTGSVDAARLLGSAAVVVGAFDVSMPFLAEAAAGLRELRSARDTFDALGTVQWAERARQELRTAGETSRNREPEAWDRLSPQEIQIATMAAEGLSNREIGQKLFLSHRTVGSHLYRIFPKLGVTARSQLRDVIDELVPV